MTKYIVIILISFILLSLLSCGGAVRRTIFYTPDGQYDGYVECTIYGCAFYDRYGRLEATEKYDRVGEQN